MGTQAKKNENIYLAPLKIAYCYDMALKDEIVDELIMTRKRWKQCEGVIRYARSQRLYDLEEGQQVHDYPELFLQLAGTNVFTVAGQEFRLEKGEALLIPGGVPHGEVALDGRKEAFRMLVFPISPQWLSYIKTVKGKQSYPMVEAVIHSANAHPRALENLTIAAAQLLAERSGRQLAYSVMTSVIDFLLDGLERGPREGWMDDSDFSSRVLAVVRSRFVQNECNVANVAAELGMTPNHLSARFRRETGMRLSEVILSERLEQSRRLLALGDLSVADVAARSGFRDPSYFIRCFRTHFDETPLAFRKKRRV